ncbi:hypothetical protein MC7420_3343 [Coleofasciculus chthonoplastes PCC 7420]|uniref:Uncharacterized protein n=1 Tax=Coleofasciculus chthonoplastes PCC 7420 TaxID=118168 RepID=B4VZ59_9CYAN|nr:hypothetical protein MC7420_3343 [Coleofasciculus chthonoplastes PCC 7420]
MGVSILYSLLPVAYSLFPLRNLKSKFNGSTAYDSSQN